MINFNDYVNENKIQHNKNWPYRILIIGGSGSGKTNLLLNLIENNNNEDVELITHKERYISLEGRQQIMNELRLVPRKDEYF